MDCERTMDCKKNMNDKDEILFKVISIKKDDLIQKETKKGIVEENQREYLAQLLNLSKKWVEEKCTPSYLLSEESDFMGKDVFVAMLNNEIIAYILGEIKILEEKTSYNEIGEKAYELDEFYVLEEYRNKGIGKSLYQFVEGSVKDKVDVIGLIASSRRYEELLRFYIDELKMQFNHALLVKRMDGGEDEE